MVENGPVLHQAAGERFADCCGPHRHRPGTAVPIPATNRAGRLSAARWKTSIILERGPSLPWSGQPSTLRVVSRPFHRRRHRPARCSGGIRWATLRRVLFLAGGLAAALLAAGACGAPLHPTSGIGPGRCRRKLGAGDYRARVGLPDDRSEFGVLARAFDAMAEALERRERERELTGDAARKMAAVLESTTDGICEIDRDWCNSFINTRARAIVGPDRDLIGIPLFEAFRKPSAACFNVNAERAMAEGVPVTFEEYFGAHDLWLSVRAFPTSDGLMICFQDVTARRQADRGIERTEAHHRAIVATAVDGMVGDRRAGRDPVLQPRRRTPVRLWRRRGHRPQRHRPDAGAGRRRPCGYIWNYRRGADRNVIGRGRELKGCRKDGSSVPAGTVGRGVAGWPPALLHRLHA